MGDDIDAGGNIITEAEPGTFETLPNGFDFKEFNPQHPSGNFSPFMKSVLRGIASGLNVSYNSLASDLESVNYSSIRAGTIDERDNWQTIQRWMIDAFCQPVFEDWLFQVIASGKINLPLAKFAKFNSPKWQPRGWRWVDPLKDIQANILGIRSGVQTRADTVGEEGEDLEEMFQQLSAEKDLAKKYGLDFDLDIKGGGSGSGDTGAGKVAEE
jgi:lambda family phage portal protein